MICKVHGEYIDVVNLRGDTNGIEYSSPNTALGTPTEDAFRRDLTINALFYNINELKIEDLTGQGLRDLQLRIARTPLNPLRTFTDDPLRILRTLRFAQRYDLAIAPEIFWAAGQSEVQKVFGKLSNERVTQEMNKIVEGKNAHVALQRMAEVQVLETCLAVPDDEVLEAAWQKLGR